MGLISFIARWESTGKDLCKHTAKTVLAPERKKSYRRPFSSQNAVRRVVQKTGGHIFLAAMFMSETLPSRRDV